ncbi:hypothetical protein AMTRI_Chr01g114960 [Amborella trichopoda]
MLFMHFFKEKKSPRKKLGFVSKVPKPVFAAYFQVARNRGTATRPKCEYCNQLGHTKAMCWALQGKPAAPPTSLAKPAAHQVTDSSVNSSNEKISQLIVLLQGKDLNRLEV